MPYITFFLMTILSFKGVWNKKENLYNYMIEKYIKKGGRLFTLGSDAHNIKEYAYKFDEAKNFLLSKNIKEIILFKDKIIMQKLLI